MSIKTWDRYHCYGMFLLSFLYFFIPDVKILATFGVISFTALWIMGWNSIKHLQPRGGLANRVTLIRLIGLLAVVTFSERIPNLTMAVFLTLVISLDGLDGYIARKKNQKTEFGALFDMETDALFVCLVSCILVERGLAGWWILIAGWMRYYYYVLTDLTKLNKIPEPRTRFGATIAVILFVALILAFVLPETIRTIILAIALALLVGSFGYSLVRVIRLR